MPATRRVTALRKPEARSRITNGKALLSGLDGRCVWARRMSDLISLHILDLGGADAASEAELSLVRRAATLTVELELLELKFAKAGGADTADLDLYQRAANSLRRLLETVGLKRRPKDITPLPLDYARHRDEAAA
jgi:hypothetical protein